VAYVTLPRLVLVGAVALAGCGRGAEPTRPLLDGLTLRAALGTTGRLIIYQAGEAVEVAVPTPRRVRVGESDRRALLTAEGLVWRGARLPGGGGSLEVSVAAVGPPGTESLVEVRVGDLTVLRRKLASGSDWQSLRTALRPRSSGGLVLASHGEAPVAWSELFLSPGTLDPRPNLILVSIDTLRADHLSCYGYERPTTPHLDALAAEGTLFRSSAAAATWTLPSTATLLTGLLPDQHRLHSLEDRLAPSVVTLAERLRGAGYRTAAFTDGGFVGPEWGFYQGFERYDFTRGEAWEPKDAAVIAERTAQWLEDNRFQPFFLFVHTYETHQPYTRREGFAGPFLPPGYHGPLGDEVGAFSLVEPGRSRADREWAEALYDGEIARADHYLGGLLAGLVRGPLGARTAVVVTSDHGEEFLEHGGVEHGHGKVFDENVMVPLIVRPPGGAAGREVATPVSGADVVPILLKLAGLPRPEGLVGRSLPQLMTSRPDRPRLVQGINSFPEIHERRYRLDVGSLTLVFDRVRGEVTGFDRGSDPDMVRPRAVSVTGRWKRAILRLQTLMAWMSEEAGGGGGGTFLARLPEGATMVATPPGGSGVRLVGTWLGLHFTPSRGTAKLPDPVLPVLLALAPSADRGAAILEVERRLPREGTRQLRLRRWARPAKQWSPLDGPLPEALVVFPAYEPVPVDRVQLAPELRRELGALGYLR
jgi:arylsulfatase A-like enzyme